MLGERTLAHAGVHVRIRRNARPLAELLVTEEISQVKAGDAHPFVSNRPPAPRFQCCLGHTELAATRLSEPRKFRKLAARCVPQH